MNTDTITLSKMRFHACHGAVPQEKTQPQPWEVTVSIEVSLHEAGATDNLEKTIDYRQIYEAVRVVMEGPSLNLAEAIAERIAQSLLREFGEADAVSVEVFKPEPPVDFSFEGLRVRVRRVRGGASYL